MKDLIKKILKEGDFDRVEDSKSPNIPLKDISDWVYETRYKIAPVMQSIDEFKKQNFIKSGSNNLNTTNSELLEDVLYSITQIGTEISNIYDSLEQIDEELHSLSFVIEDDE